MITFRHKGDYRKATKYFEKLRGATELKMLDKYGKAGVAALSAATPVDTGKTAASWGYEIHRTPEYIEIAFTNSNVVRGINIAVILQYGHGTGTGGWVQGRDYINPAIRPVFDQIAKDAWEEVTGI